MASETGEQKRVGDGAAAATTATTATTALGIIINVGRVKTERKKKKIVTSARGILLRTLHDRPCVYMHVVVAQPRADVRFRRGVILRRRRNPAEALRLAIVKTL